MSTVTPGRATPSRNGTPKRTAAARPTPTGPCPKADQQAKRVGDSDPALTYTCATKLADGDSLTGELVRDKGERIGQYRIRIGTLNAGDNYDIRFKESWLVILSRTLPIPTATPQPTATPTPTEKPQPVQRDYTLLARLKNVGKKGTSLQLAWTKVSGADGYDVYFARYDKKDRLYKTVPAGDTSLRVDGLNRNQCYKANVVAWKRVKGSKYQPNNCKRKNEHARTTTHLLRGSRKRRDPRDPS
ncbi:MAG: hypothetical protein IJ119_14115 [Clostridia bacterium]|nr:hypothetical protein [Clostridia bacterium]